jgi:hypothetical protein
VSQAATFATHRPSHWQELAAEASRDLYTYCVFVRGIWPNDPAHRPIMEALLGKDPWLLLLGPPGLGKSTIVIAYCEWTLGRDNDYRWLFASERQSGRAQQAVTEMKDTIADNERFHMCFGQLKGRQNWGATSFTLVPRRDAPPSPFPWLPPRGRSPRVAWASAAATSWRAGAAGMRADGLVLDDITSDRSANSPVVTKQIHESVHKKLIPRLNGSPKDRRVIATGQRFMPRDVWGLFLEEGEVVYDNNPGLDGLEVMEDEEAA